MGGIIEIRTERKREREKVKGDEKGIKKKYVEGGRLSQSQEIGIKGRM